MDDLQAAFEWEMNVAWQARNFSAWNDIRLIYADWLEENNHPLWRMARLLGTMRPCTVPTSGGPRIWMWRLFFNVPALVGKPRPRWWANQRMNAQQILGLPPYTLRCKGFDWNETEGNQEIDGSVRFTVTFRPRKPTRYVSNIRYGLRGGEQRPVALDTDIHPDGFAALFWGAPGGEREVTPNDVKSQLRQKELFP